MRLPVSLSLAVVLVAGCGGDEPEPAQQAPPPTEQPEAEPMPAEPESQAQPEPEPEPRPVGDEALYTVQVAAFVDAATAREWAGRLGSQGLPVWTTEARVEGRTFHRLRIGALPSYSDTRRLAGMITARFGWPVWIAPLTPADRPPPNAAQNTREILRGG